MKHILFTLITLVTLATSFTHTTDTMITFIDLTNAQKTQWILWSAKKQQEKAQLLVDEMKEWTNYKTLFYKQLNNIQTPEQLKTMLDESIKKAVEIYEKNVQKMSDFWINKSNEAKKIHQEQQDKFTAFKKTLNLTDETVKTEESEETDIPEVE